jgi:anti-sigma B factor antagonist
MSHALVLPDSIGGCADALPPAFVCSWTGGGMDAGWVHVAGELDIATAPQLERTLREAQLQAHLVVLDLRELAFIDSCGVHTIVDASIRARQAGHQLLLVHGPPEVDRVFTLTGCSDEVVIGDFALLEPRPKRFSRSVRRRSSNSRKSGPHRESGS